jgi:hypothetical protein
MTLVCRPTPVGRVQPHERASAHTNSCIGWHDLRTRSCFPHGPSPWNLAKRDSVAHVQKNYSFFSRAGCEKWKWLFACGCAFHLHVKKGGAREAIKVRSRSVLCKDRVNKSFRSLYTQRPAQSSVLRRSFGFNAEVAEYACISRLARCDHKLAQNGIVEHIPGLSVQCVIIYLQQILTACITIAEGEMLTLCRPRCLRSFLLFFKTLSAHSRSVERYC